MQRLKWITLLALSGLIAVGIATGITTPTQYHAQMQLRQAEHRGDVLFHSQALGMNGLSCDTCHVDGGRFSHRLGLQRIPSLVQAKRAFPLVTANREIVTLEDQINLCLMHHMEGHALSPESPKLALLDLYLRHLSRFHER